MTLTWTAKDLGGLDPSTVLISDTECGPGHWLSGFKRLSDGKVLTFEKSRRRELNRDRLRRIMDDHTIVGFNYLNYDWPMVSEAINGASNDLLKQRNDQIIGGNIRYWQAENMLGYRLPQFDIIDLIEPQPNAWASLKTLNGRMHGRWMQDLPYHHDQELTDEEIEFTAKYMVNDLTATELLLWNLREPLALRVALGKTYQQDFRSKSDSQIGEAIVKKRVEKLTGKRVEKVETPPGTTFKYQIPPYLAFQNPQLVEVLEKLRTAEFLVKADGKVDLPKWLSDTKITIGSSTYAMGIGGLHSTEANRALFSDALRVLIDFDVASYYPAIILGSGLYPKALGPLFLEIYRVIRDERVRAKKAGEKVTAEGLKIALNGVFGKLGSRYSILYAPHLMIAVTLTGQLALLMLIDRAEAAGIPVVSGNTDGVVFHCPRDREDDLKAITKQWEIDTGFELEDTRYKALLNLSVNTYMAIKEDGKAKRKGTLANPWADESDIRGQLMKNPNMTICSDAALAFIKDGIPLEQTILGSKDIRGFVGVVNVQGGGKWRDDYLGKVVRYIWSVDGDIIEYKTPDPRTGNNKKVPKTDGCRPLMTLTDDLPADIDYDRYVAEAREILMDLGVAYRPSEAKKITIRGRHQALRWLRYLAVLD